MNERLALARATLEQAEYKAGLRLVRAHPSGSSENGAPGGRGERGEREGGAARDGAAPQVSGAVAVDAYPVPEYLAPVFPHGMARGAPVEVSGSCALPLLLAGAASQQGAWVAFVGAANIGWAMADHSGLDRSRVAYIPDVPAQGAQVAGAAVDGFDVVVLGAGVNLDRREKRVLDRRARTKNTLLICSNWESATMKVSCQLDGIGGISRGRGHISTMSYVVSSRYGSARLSYSERGWGTDHAGAATGGGSSDGGSSDVREVRFA